MDNKIKRLNTPEERIRQSLMLKNAYATTQEHLGPDVIADIPILVPKDRSLVEKIGYFVNQSIDKLENSISLGNLARDLMFLNNSVLYSQGEQIY